MLMGNRRRPLSSAGARGQMTGPPLPVAVLPRYDGAHRPGSISEGPISAQDSHVMARADPDSEHVRHAPTVGRHAKWRWGLFTLSESGPGRKAAASPPLWVYATGHFLVPRGQTGFGMRANQRPSNRGGRR